MIDVHVPSVRKGGLFRLASSMVQTGLVDLGATLSVCAGPKVNIKELKEEFPFTKGIPEEKEVTDQIASGRPPPMFALRRSIHNLGINCRWMLLDDDDYFREGSAKYIRKSLEWLDWAESATNRPMFLGTAGFFGSNYKSDKIHISPRNALMPKGHGIIFGSWFDLSRFTEFDDLDGGLEEHLFCALAIKMFDAVPLKRFQNPAYVKFRKEVDRKSSPIHDWEIWNSNSMEKIRELSRDRDWKYPSGMGKKGVNFRNSPKPFEDRSRRIREDLKEEGLDL